MPTPCGRCTVASDIALLGGLLDEMDAQRERFSAGLADVEPALMTAPGVVGDWSARDLVHHVAFWAEHGTAVIALAVAGRGAEFAYDRSDTDGMNARAVAEAGGFSAAAVREREYRSFVAFRAAVAGLPPELLGQPLGNGDTLEQVIRYDGPDHYAEHAAHLREWFADGD